MPFFRNACTSCAAFFTTSCAVCGCMGLPTMPFWRSMTTRAVVDLSSSSSGMVLLREDMMARGIYALGVRGLFSGNGLGGRGITPLHFGILSGLMDRHAGISPPFGPG